MGRDLTLYPRSASRAELKAYLEDLGFERCQHLWDWPAGTLNYAWFDEQDYKSIDGVSADVYPISADEAKRVGGRTQQWALHVRNVYSASWHDVKMLNDVLRGARTRFGGTIRGDYGTNRYAPLWKDESTPVSRGLSATFQRVAQELQAVRFALPDPLVGHAVAVEDTDKKMRSLAEFTQSLDPARVIYNGLVPFAVSIFEYFFSRVFIVLIGHDPYALERRATYSLKVDFPTLLQVSSHKRSVEEVIAGTYTFQNLEQLNKAYKEWLGIDVRNLLFKKRRIGRQVSFLQNRIAQIIQYRHGIVHHFELDRSLTKEGYLAILDAVEASINEMLKHLEKKYKVTIDRT